MTMNKIKTRLEYLRRELQAERMSYGELAELQSLVEHIDDSDVELLEAAGVAENGYQCGSCERTFERLSPARECPYCASGNWVEGLIDDQEEA